MILAFLHIVSILAMSLGTIALIVGMIEPNEETMKIGFGLLAIGYAWSRFCFDLSQKE